MIFSILNINKCSKDLKIIENKSYASLLALWLWISPTQSFYVITSSATTCDSLEPIIFCTIVLTNIPAETVPPPSILLPISRDIFIHVHWHKTLLGSKHCIKFRPFVQHTRSWIRWSVSSPVTWLYIQFLEQTQDSTLLHSEWLCGA